MKWYNLLNIFLYLNTITNIKLLSVPCAFLKTLWASMMSLTWNGVVCLELGSTAVEEDSFG